MIGGIYPGQTYPAGEPNVLVVTVSSAAATASAPAPAVRFSLAAPAELATASGPAPTPRDQVTAPAALATASAPAPTPQEAISAPAAAAIASALAPVPQERIASPSALATASMPVPAAGEVEAVPAGLATASAPVSAIAISLAPPPAQAIASMPDVTTSFVPDVTAPTGGDDAWAGIGERPYLRRSPTRKPMKRRRVVVPRDVKRARRIAGLAARPLPPLEFAPAPEILIPQFAPFPAVEPIAPDEVGDTFPSEWAEEEELLLLGVL